LESDAGISCLRLPILTGRVHGCESVEVPLVDSFGGSCYVIQHTFAAVNFLSIMGIASGFETETVSVELAELLAQGVSCGVAAAVGSAPVSGSLSRSQSHV
jgi:hypothetical protein